MKLALAVPLVGTCLVLAGAAPVQGAREGVEGAPTAQVVPGRQYAAGWLHRLLLGSHHRSLWTTPLRVEVLDLETFAGGLTPIKRGGRGQTKSLRFLGADGRQYVLRSVDKDPEVLLSPELRETFVARLLEDQMSVGHPAGALVVPPLLEAVGVLHAEPRLVVAPDDARLGEFRAEFAGMLGTIEERPAEAADGGPGFAGAVEIVSTEELFKRLGRSPDDRVDSKAYLAARLIDFYVGDWDRHTDQWRWACFDGAEPRVWEPIPRDRDQAFARLDGLLLWLAGFSHPELVGFEADYPAPWRMAWSGRVTDRRLLVDLEKADWDAVAAELQRRLTDAVIDQAVDRLPPEYRRTGPPLARALRSRRDRLPAVARAFYAVLAGDVDIHATDAPEVAEIERLADGRVSVRVTAAGGRGTAADTPYYRRTFDPHETREVRLYLHGGDDRARVTGGGGSSVRVRVVGGGGDDELIDAARGGPTHFYDSRGENRLSGGAATRVDLRPYSTPHEDATPGRFGAIGISQGAPVRDWGEQWRPSVSLGFHPDQGAIVGTALALETYGFRRQPYAVRHAFALAYATGPRGVRALYTGDFRRENAESRFELRARASGIEILRFHGFGNETPAAGGDALFAVRQDQYLIEPSFVVPVSRRAQLAFATFFEVSDTQPDAQTLLGQTRPYGVGSFREWGVRAECRVDGRNRPVAATRGLYVAAGGRFIPALASVREAFGEGHGTVAAYLTPRFAGRPTLALRLGGKRVWGDHPFHEAAFLGGAQTLRGFGEQRFVGDSALYANAELRVRLGSFFLLLPGEIGVFGLADTGRVWMRGETSSLWHSAAGGGIWFAFLNPANTVSIAVAHGRERTTLHVGAGFLF